MQNLHIHSPGIPTASLATASIVIGSPTVLAGAHPAVVGATFDNSGYKAIALGNFFYLQGISCLFAVAALIFLKE